MDDDFIDLTSDDQKADKPNKRKKNSYTLEEKIVGGVWYHERLYTNLTYREMQDNFKVRFNKSPPQFHTFRDWEKALFNSSLMVRSGLHKKRTKKQYLQIPYVKESFRSHPNLPMLQRAALLGIPQTVLYTMLRDDFTPEEIEKLKREGQKESRTENQEQD
ncbi:unnamed protein product [Acanthoscelides obtectus]|uniref:Uncharacterized protein n=1 Tax=Acanthoscelides obtectus TaxID=200917 RepID=A0A9P0KMN0_ACAOB|nr:unnamed protein product [Acanthoscelides obtectus]CAK1669236.1 hypothetical protein AOBTE_LOCUS26889 [Acanthoscelides obtectus]